MYIGLHVKYCYAHQILMKLQFSPKFKKKISNFTKIHPVGGEVFHADGRTDMTKPRVTFCNFVNTPKTGIQQIY